MTTPSYIAIGVAPSGEDVDRSYLDELAAIRFTLDVVEAEWVGDNLPFSDLSIEQAGARLQAELSKATPIGHNAATILRRAGVRSSKTPIDTLTIAQVLDPCAPSYSLNDLCKRYHIIAGPRIRGDFADADLTRQLFLALRKRWLKLSPDTQAKLYALSSAARLTSPLYAFIAAMPNLDSLKPLRRPVEPPPHEPPADDDPREEEQPPKVDLAGKHLSQLTASVFGSAAGMEDRKEQRGMAGDVARVLNGGGLGLIEAGTGVGKSLAYLVPSAIWAAATGQRAMIATHTKNLQGQLLENEVRRLRMMLAPGLPEVAQTLRVAVLRGRANYLCRRNVDRALEAWLKQDNDREQVANLLLARIIVWQESTSTGDREELQLAEDEQGWERLSASDVSCLRDGCAYVAAGLCFLDRAYKRAGRSHIIIANQWLLMASLLNPQSRVPSTSAVIIDEAHFLEDVATDMLGRQVSRRAVHGAINRVASENERNATLASRSPGVGLGQPFSLVALVAQVRRSRDAIDGLWEQIEQFHADLLGERSDDAALLLTPALRALDGWRQVRQRWQTAKRRLEALTGKLGEIEDTARERAEEADDDQPAELLAFAQDASWMSDSLQGLMQNIDKIIAEDSEQTVRWLDVADRDTPETESVLNAAPLNVGAQLSGLLWSRREARTSIVLTGATLTVRNKRWDFLRDRLALPTAAREQVYGSPFDYQQQSRIFVAIRDDVPWPPTQSDSTDYAEYYEAALAEALTRLAVAAGGRTLVLFTSYSTMYSVADLVRAPLRENGLELKVQRRDGTPGAVADELRNRPQTVVFGVNSLWTGVDIAGENLSLLIICRLPFTYPHEPVHAARAEQYRPRDFFDFTLPLAILRLRQGFGRLIRSRSDRGVCVILDSRLNTKPYAGDVRQSLPRRLESASVAKIATEIEAFLPPNPPDNPPRATI